MKTYKVLGALLAYPSEALIEALPELAAALDEERAVPEATRRGLERLLAELERTDLLTLQERYVDLFDRVRSLSLHLFEHVHGESRDRGQALVDLLRLYRQHGFEMAGDELPDFIPAFLEFLAHVPANEARGLLGETGRIVQGLRARLAKRGSPYAAVFEALLLLCGAPCLPEETIDDAQIRLEDDPGALDRQWAEEPAFAPIAGSCGVKPADVSVVKFHTRSSTMTV
jgi:nitrate reductase molybdenum cofactor assembly chaperone NarJ/NarW